MDPTMLPPEDLFLLTSQMLGEQTRMGESYVNGYFRVNISLDYKNILH